MEWEEIISPRTEEIRRSIRRVSGLRGKESQIVFGEKKKARRERKGSSMLHLHKMLFAWQIEVVSDVKEALDGRICFGPKRGPGGEREIFRT